MAKIPNDKLHRDAMALFCKLTPGTHVRTAMRKVAGYHERRKILTRALQPILTKMDARMKSGEKVGGCGSMEDYCKQYKQQGCLTYARVRQIITGKSGNEGKVKSLDLESLIGKIVLFEGKKYKVADNAEAISFQPGRKYSDGIRLAVTEIKEEKPAEIPATKNASRRNKKATSALMGLKRKADSWIRKYQNDFDYTDTEYLADINQLEAETKARAIYQKNPQWFDSYFHDIRGRAQAAIADRNKHYPEMSEPAKALAAVVGSMTCPNEEKN